MSSAHVIEVDEITAGIVVFDHGRFRFFASEQACHPLDGVLFRTVDQATRAVRRILTGKRRCERMDDARRDCSDQTTTAAFLSTRPRTGSASPWLCDGRVRKYGAAGPGSPGAGGSGSVTSPQSWSACNERDGNGSGAE